MIERADWMASGVESGSVCDIHTLQLDGVPAPARNDQMNSFFAISVFFNLLVPRETSETHIHGLKLHGTRQVKRLCYFLAHSCPKYFEGPFIEVFVWANAQHVRVYATSNTKITSKH